jgi:hypothetical protein
VISGDEESESESEEDDDFVAENSYSDNDEESKTSDDEDQSSFANQLDSCTESRNCVYYARVLNLSIQCLKLYLKTLPAMMFLLIVSLVGLQSPKRVGIRPGCRSI